MPSLGDSAFIFILALILFGPKRLPELARQLGKLMGEFRRASNEFRMQMEDELRVSEQEERQKKIAAMEAAAPIAPTPALEASVDNTIAIPADGSTDAAADEAKPDRYTIEPPAVEPLPIASAGELNMMPPSTGLPESRSPLSPVLDAIPQTPEQESATGNGHHSSQEASIHG